MTAGTRSRLTMVALGALVLPGVLGGGAVAGETAQTAKKPKATSKVRQVTQQFLLPTSPDRAESAVNCPEGTTLIGGGATLSGGPLTSGVALDRSAPLGNGWTVRYDNGGGQAYLPTVTAICIQNRLKVKGADGKPKARSSVRQVTQNFLISGTNAIEIDVSCPAGTTVVGGGAGNSEGADLIESGPQGNGWHVRYAPAGEVLGTASAVCLKNKLKVTGAEGGNPKARSRVTQLTQLVLLPAATMTNPGRAQFDLACPQGTTVVGGGGRLPPGTPLAPNDSDLEESGPQGNAWHVRFDNNLPSSQAATIHALCLQNKLKVK
jgi:hypothetical protein